jgi:hypothetical protein
MNTIIYFLLAFLMTVPAVPQASDTCVNGQYLVVDLVNKRYKCQSGPLIYRAKAINLNAGANTDVATISGLPSRYIIRRASFENASATPTLATVALRTAAAGGGTAIVTAQVLSSLTTTTKFIDVTFAANADAQTAPTLTLRTVANAGSAITVDFTIVVDPLN